MASRASSPLSSFASSPSIHSPPRGRSPSISSSSAGSHPDSYDELAGFSDGEPTSKKKSGGAGVYDPDALTTAQCQWGDCTAEFYELEPMIEHLHSGEPA